MKKLAQESGLVCFAHAIARGISTHGCMLGANAMRAFEGLGIIEHVKRNSQSMGTASVSFKFVRGTEPHDIIYDVRF